MAKFHWQTDDLVKIFQAELAPKGHKVNSQHPGGDHDTDRIIVDVGDCGGFFVAGWVVADVIPNHSDAFVEVITVEDGRDSRGGLTSNDPKMIQAYADIRIILGRLIEDTETYIANHYHEFF